MPRKLSHRNASKRHSLTLQVLEDRRVMAAGLGEPPISSMPVGALTQDTGEFMLGRIAVTPILLESDGSDGSHRQNWSPEEIDGVLAKVDAAVQWWSDTLDQLGSVHSLEFIVDDTYARTPLDIGYEPIDRPSSEYRNFVGDFLTSVDLGSSASLNDGMFAFNDSQRERLGTDWAFSIFIVDSSDDADGFFPNGGPFRGAFAFAGGLFYVTPSERPISTYTHEIGHLFWAFDEYTGGSSYNETRGYYGAANDNASNNPASGFEQEDSLMADFNRLIASYESNELPESTRALIGWRDSDGDGIFDVLDVPLSLEGTGLLDQASGKFHFVADASVNTLPNRNTSGNQSDITLNRISRLEMSVDGGDWQTVAQPGTPTATFDLMVDVPEVFQTVDFRVIDAATGVTSPTLSGTATTPLLNASPLIGFNYIDNDRNGNRSAGEPLLIDTVIDIMPAFGGSAANLASGELDARDLPRDTDIPTTNGITLRGNTISSRDEIQVQTHNGLTDRELFHVYDRQLNRWVAKLDSRLGFDAIFDHPTSRVSVDVVSLSNRPGYARVEGFDINGDLVARSTTDVRNHPDGPLSVDEQQTLTLADPQNRIVTLKVSGLNNADIGVAAIRYGISSTITTDANGAFTLADVPDGEYEITVTPADGDLQIQSQTIVIAAGSLVGGPLELRTRPKISPRFNTAIAEDTNGDGVVTAVDALQIINDINLRGSRSLKWNDYGVSKVDVTNDGVVTAIDALRVINRLNSQDGGGSASSEPLSTFSNADDDDDDRRAANGDFDVAPLDQVLTQTQKWVSI